jgi:pilus assembly protein TadC
MPTRSAPAAASAPEAAVAKAGIKMLFPIVPFILPVLFVITLVPGILTVLRDIRGGIGGH